jgi:hypothetical protein
MLRLCFLLMVFSLSVWGCGADGEDDGVADTQSSVDDAEGASSEGDAGGSSSQGDAEESMSEDVEAGPGADGETSEDTAGSMAGCEDFVGLSTAEQLAKTPRENANAERLALRLSEELVAPDMEYERIATDLAFIRAFTDEVDHIHAFPNFGVSGLVAAFSETVIDAIDDGSYTAWDCQHEWYGLKSYEVHKLFTYNVNIAFEGIYHPERLVEAYQDLPGLDSIQAPAVNGDGNNISLCTASFGGIHRYYFTEGRGDCPSGCTGGALWGYDVTEAGEITAYEYWEYGDGAAVPDMPTPEWVEAPCP